MDQPTATLETLSVHTCIPTAVAETLDLGVVGLCTTDKRSILVCGEKCISDSRRPIRTSAVVFQQIETRNDDFPGTDVCFGVCQTVDGDRCPETWASS